MAGSGEAAGEARAGAEGRPRPAGLAPAASPFPCLLRARGLQDLSGDGGVRKEELRPGSGQAVPPGASVAVKYSGYLEHCDEPFCTNCYSKSPGLMKLGKDITLGGLEIGLLTMKKGEVARFVFTPYYAYGQQGCPPLIPPNATVMFEVEVLDFLDSEECDAFFELTAACLCMTEYEKARDFLVRAQHIQPFNHDINNELKKLARTSPADKRAVFGWEGDLPLGTRRSRHRIYVLGKGARAASCFESVKFCVYTQPDFPEVGFVCHILRLFPEEPSPAVGEEGVPSLCVLFEENSSLTSDLLQVLGCF
ncbi:inactive peptidyl-prolyl cis-trans isomerase FKBP6 isoform 8-T9 [Theristicus caerulescens]